MGIFYETKRTEIIIQSSFLRAWFTYINKRQMIEKDLKEMFDNLLHIGNKTNYWNPKMKEYIHSSTNGVHIINLIKTTQQIASVNSQLQELHAAGKKVLFVATKLQARDGFRKLAEATNNYYVCEKWVPGLLTNFKTIRKRINTYIKLLKDAEVGGFDMLTKKEKSSKMLELEKLDKAFHGLKDMRKVPDVVFVIDGAYESQALREANSLKLTCFAISNTNGNPAFTTDMIPANTNSVKSIDYLATVLKDGFKTPAKKMSAGPTKTEDQKSVEKTEKKEEEVIPAKKVPEKKKEEKLPVEKKKITLKKVPINKTEEKVSTIKKTPEKKVPAKKTPVKKAEKK